MKWANMEKAVSEVAGIWFATARMSQSYSARDNVFAVDPSEQGVHHGYRSWLWRWPLEISGDAAAPRQIQFMILHGEGSW